MSELLGAIKLSVTGLKAITLVAILMILLQLLYTENNYKYNVDYIIMRKNYFWLDLFSLLNKRV